MSETDNINQPEESLRSWAIFIPKKDIPKIQKEIDKIFSGYSFYPEFDWKKYGYSPPDGHQVLGAWRHSQTKVFAFLLDNPQIETYGSNAHLLLYTAGSTVEISKLEPKIEALKSKVALIETKNRTLIQDEERLKGVSKKPLIILMAVLCTFGGITSYLSEYLRKIPPPKFGNEVMAKFYGILMEFLHLSALILLLIVTIICIAFLLKYGYLLIKRL